MNAPTANALRSAFDLTVTESNVLLSIAHGGTNADAATAAGIAEKTVKVHLSNICRKMGERGGSSRVRLALRAWGCPFVRPGASE